MLSRIHHKNLVSLIGYCQDKDRQMLIYEYLPKGSLRDHLYGKRVHFSFVSTLYSIKNMKLCQKQKTSKVNISDSAICSFIRATCDDSYDLEYSNSDCP